MDIDGQVVDWHLSQGGAGHRAAGHALRIFRECFELCVASGSSRNELFEAFLAEMDKADKRQEFSLPHSTSAVLEEFVDVKMLMTVFKRYFIIPRDLDSMEWQKLAICRQRQWEADADGVLWRPGTRGAGKLPGGAESS